jgi:hypothetical protein
MVGGLSPDERDALGKTARTKVPRRSHGEWEPASARPDPIDLLEQQAATRVAELVPIRYGRMLASPFAFFRGAALIMASDLGVDAPFGLSGAALRRRAPVQRRGLRDAGATSRVRRKRL